MGRHAGSPPSRIRTRFSNESDHFVDVAYVDVSGPKSPSTKSSLIAAISLILGAISNTRSISVDSGSKAATESIEKS